MNLLLYLLLAPSSDSHKSSLKSRPPKVPAASDARARVVPERAVLARGGRLHQASRSRVAYASRQKFYSGRLSAALGVVFNAMGFLLLTSGLLFLLQMAQISLY